jgi:hypothetical protein
VIVRGGWHSPILFSQTAPRVFFIFGVIAPAASAFAAVSVFCRLFCHYSLRTLPAFTPPPSALSLAGTFYDCTGVPGFAVFVEMVNAPVYMTTTVP